MATYIGIDPGASGGLAVITGKFITKTGMPTTERDIWNLLRPFGHICVFAVLEKVGGFIAGNPAPGSAMFNFGKNVGLLTGFLIAANIPFEEITPQKWQKGLGITPRKKDEGKTVWKNRLKQFAERLFPNEKITLATADCLLIAEYCKRVREGKIGK